MGCFGAPVRAKPRVATLGSEILGLQPAVSGVRTLTGASPSRRMRRSATMSETFARAFPMAKPSRRLSEIRGRGARVTATVDVREDIQRARRDAGANRVRRRLADGVQVHGLVRH